MTQTHFGFKTVNEQDKASHVRGVFDSVAPKYDIMNDLMSMGLHRAWKAYTVMVANVSEGSQVLDIAGGTGDLALAFAKNPWTPEMVQPASIDVRLDRFFRLFNNHAYTYVDPAENQGALTEQFDVAPDEPWILHPGEFALGSTWEYVKLDATVAARLEGKSSLGRLGILTHSTAGFIDPGFEGHITLELSNVSTLPVKLWPGMKIGQMCFFQLSSPAEHPYGSKGTGSHYQGQRGPTPSRSYVNFYKADVND